MAIEFKLPELGENIEKGDLIKILVSVGDTIAQDQPVLELETDKATIEVPSPVRGTVKSIHVKEGEQVKVGQLILIVGDGTEAKAAEKAEPKPGQFHVEAPTPPKPRAPQPAARLAPASSEAVEPKAVVTPEGPTQIAPAAPSIRRLARELGVDINQVPGSGPGGRISEEDVRAHARGILTGFRAAPIAQGPTVPLPDFSQWGEIERKAMSNVRRKTAEHMSRAWATVPQVTQFDKADITALEELRRRYSKKVEEAGGKLTVTAIALKITASALKLFPPFGASLDTRTNEIIYKRYCHIGVAVDTDRGLLVPVIRHANRKNILELSVELAAVAERARNKKLALEDMEGGVFTITNLGGIGGTGFSPIVNFPEVAILGISRAALEPVFANGQFAPHLMLPLALSYDHRLIDGADAARFLRWVAEALEQPFLLPLQG